jgi:hypothetical protein
LEVGYVLTKGRTLAAEISVSKDSNSHASHLAFLRRTNDHFADGSHHQRTIDEATDDLHFLPPFCI